MEGSLGGFVSSWAHQVGRFDHFRTIRFGGVSSNPIHRPQPGSDAFPSLHTPPLISTFHLSRCSLGRQQ